MVGSGRCLGKQSEEDIKCMKRMVIILFVRKQNDEDEEDIAKLGSPAEF